MTQKNIIYFAFLLSFCGCSLYDEIFGPHILHNYKTYGVGMGWYVRLMSDSTYIYYDYSCTNSSYSEGYWHKVGDTLILNSKFIPQIISQAEFRERGNKNVKVIVNDITGNPWGCIHVNHITPDSTYRVKFGPFVDLDDTIPSYQLSPSQVVKLGCNFSISAGNYDLNFSIRDTLANKIIVTLNYTADCFDDTAFVKDYKFLNNADTLFYLLSNNLPYRDSPAFDMTNN